MIRLLLKLVAYSRAPKLAFALLHPIRALKWGMAFYAGKKLYERARGMAEQWPVEESPSTR
jgi:hypothetical protein